MLKDEAVQHFGSKAGLARALGITQAAVSQWGERVPLLRAMQLERLTGGKLKAPPMDTASRKQVA